MASLGFVLVEDSCLLSQQILRGYLFAQDVSSDGGGGKWLFRRART